MVPSMPVQAMDDEAPVLEVDDLSVVANGRLSGTEELLVEGVSFDLHRGEVLAIVGESGSGKSTVCAAVAGLLPSEVRISRGSIAFEGRDLVGLPERERRPLRGAEISIVLQDPLAALNPVRSVGSQLVEARRIHGLGGRRESKAWATENLRSLGFSHPERAMRSYPVNLSGGMRQRLCVGIAFSADPKLVIADEPTTALDVSLQGRLLRLLIERAQEHRTATILVSHDVNVVGAVAGRVLVMYGGRVLESGPARTVFSSPASPYTAALLSATPRLEVEERGRPIPTIPADSGRADAAAGCPFAGRCARATEKCVGEFPDRVTVEAGHDVWCWFPHETGDERTAEQ